ncbi:hypothetical protein LZ32DRAFT_598991 [Colletotrichum eremochloae]|nr:hypothetical protein LZ32DRAFT_598991 [Colletotrichum eremochloae]
MANISLAPSAWRTQHDNYGLCHCSYLPKVELHTAKPVSRSSSLLTLLPFSAFAFSFSHCLSLFRNVFMLRGRQNLTFFSARRSSELVVTGAMLPLRNPRNKVLFWFLVSQRRLMSDEKNR